MAKMHVKTGDNVVIISGKDKGNKGKVVQVSPKEGKVIVEGLNIVTKHLNPPDGSAGRHRQGRGAALRLQGYARLPQVRQGRQNPPRD